MLSLMIEESVYGIYSIMRLRKVSYFRLIEYVIEILVEMIVELDNIGISDGFHDFQFSIFVFFVLMDMFDGNFLSVLLQIFGLFSYKYTLLNIRNRMFRFLRFGCFDIFFVLSSRFSSFPLLYFFINVILMFYI